MKIEIETRDEKLVGTVHRGAGRWSLYTDDGTLIQSRSLTPEELMAEQRHRELVNEIQNAAVDVRDVVEAVGQVSYNLTNESNRIVGKLETLRVFFSRR